LICDDNGSCKGIGFV
jgi:RNA recognition motif-containing protein